MHRDNGAVERFFSVLSRIWGSVTLRVLLVASTSGLALWVLWGPRLRHAHLYPQWGDFGGWVGGIGSIAAVAVALVQTHRLQAERFEDLRRQEEHARTQVFSWVAYREDSPGSGGWWAYFNNMTRSPIAVWILHIEDPQTHRALTLDATLLPPMLPGFTQRPAGVAAHELLSPTCRLQFADSAGECWERGVTGSIVPIPEIRLDGQVLASSTANTGDRRDR